MKVIGWIVGLIVLAGAGLVLAQSFELPIFQFSGGGGTSANDQFRLTVVTGQEIGVVGNGQFQIAAGLPAEIAFQPTDEPVTGSPEGAAPETAPTSSASPSASPSQTASSSPVPTASPTSPAQEGILPPIGAIPGAISDAIGGIVDAIRSGAAADVTEKVLVPVAVATGAATALAGLATALNTVAGFLGSLSGTLGAAGGAASGLAAGGASVGTVATVTNVVSSLFSLLLFLWNLLLEAIGLRRKRYPWGTVFDASSDDPLELSIVRLQTESGKLVETRVTDRAGRFGFLPLPGRYILNVAKPGFQLALPMTVHGTRYNPLFDGKPLAVSEMQRAITLNVPLRSQKANAGFSFGRFLGTLQRPLLLLTISLAVWNFVVIPSVLTGSVLALSLGIFAINWLVLRPKYFGRVVDATRRPVEGAIVRLLRKEDGKVVATQVTGPDGRYSFLARGGVYIMQVIANGWAPPAWMARKEPIVIRRAEGGLVDRTIVLTKTAPSPALELPIGPLPAAPVPLTPGQIPRVMTTTPQFRTISPSWFGVQ